MHGYLMRTCAAAAAGVALSTMGVAGASASGAAAPARQAVRMGPAGASLASASPGAQLWAKRYNGTGNNADVATAVAVSPTGGTVYVTGFSWGNNTAAGYATIAYSAATGVQQWAKRYNGPPGNNSDNANSIAVSRTTGTVYVTGESVGATSGSDYATVAYTPAGAQLWVKRPVGSVQYPSSVAVSPATGAVFVTGANTGDYTTTAYQS